MKKPVFWAVMALAVGFAHAAPLTVETLKPNLVRVREAGTNGSGMNRYGVLRAYEPTVRQTDETGVLTVLDGEVTVEKRGRGYRLRFPIAKDECVYGLGDVSRANIQRRPGKYEIWVKNVNSYIPIPMFITSKGRGVLVNTTWRNEIDVGQGDPDAVICTAGESPIDFYVFAGKGYRELLDVYTELTGRPALLPVFGYGFTYVCNQWIDQFALMREAQEFRDRELPCDVIGLEPGWMENFYDYTTRKRWDPDKFFFPSWNPKGRITFPHTLSQRMGFKLSLWLCCDYDLYRYEEEQIGGKPVVCLAAPSCDGFKADGETFHDTRIEESESNGRRSHTCSLERRSQMSEIFPKKDSLEGSEPWFEHLKKFVDMGARCFKLDGAKQVTPHDPVRKWANGMTTEEAHNLYPLVYGKQMAKGYEGHAKKRAMVYSAGGYAGVQQYVATWAGDTGGGPKSLVSCLNLAASGHSNQSCDMTLFNPDNSFKVTGVHFGFLQPWSQQNNWDYWDQPWYQNKTDFEMFRSYVRLRYRLIPYLYGVAAEAARTGWPMMRPLAFMHPGRSEYANLSSTYYLGDSLVVACYTNTATLPPGLWCDWWTRKRTSGPCEQPLALSEKIGGGLFVKAGAILPLLPDGVQHVERGWNAEMELHVWTGADGAAEWYEDDGDSLAYRTGAYAITPLTFKAGVLTVGRRKGAFDGMPANRRVTVVWHTPDGEMRETPRDCGSEGFSVEFGAKWYKGMLHAHSYWSDGRCLPDVAVRAYREAGYDFFALSDHNRFGMDPDRWLPVDSDFGGWPPKAIEPAQFERYRRDFPDGEWRQRDGRTEVRLKTWRELAARYNEPGRFLLLPGVEITTQIGRTNADIINLHVNYCGLEGLIPRLGTAGLLEPVTEGKTSDVIADDLREIRHLAEKQGDPPHLACVNHPHWRYFDVKPTDVIANPEIGFFEVCNNGSECPPVVGLKDDGWDNDRFWDAVLAARCTHGERLLYALAGDDTHYYPASGTAHTPVVFGDGYVCVRADALTPEAIFGAMARGDFYASSGVELEDVRFVDGELSVSVPAKAGVSPVVRFIVTRRGVPTEPVRTVAVKADGEKMPFARDVPVYDDRVGETAAVSVGRKGERLQASYRLRPDDLYVRARIESDEPSPYPHPSRLHPKVKCAWTQPYVTGRKD